MQTERPRRVTGRARIPGLDILRSLAILGVLVYHWPRAGMEWLAPIARLGWTGVDLFFVLSGYLIANQYLGPHARGLPRFYIRRFMRTLPTYYVVLAVLLVASTGPVLSPSSLTYVGFLQNYHSPALFPASWSLCIEEHFYIFFPIVVAAVAWITPKMQARVVAALIAVLLVAGALTRLLLWLRLRPDLAATLHEAYTVYLRELYYPTHVRLDGLLLGVSIAAIKRGRPATWERLLLHANRVLLIGILVLAVAAFVELRELSGPACVVGYPLLAVGYSLLTVAALSPGSALGRLNVPGAQTLAMLSYAIYLTHVPAFDAGATLSDRLGITSLPARFLAICGVTALTSSLLYLAVERPCIALRDRWFPLE